MNEVVARAEDPRRRDGAPSATPLHPPGGPGMRSRPEGAPVRRWWRIVVPVLIVAAAVLGFVMLQVLRPEVPRQPVQERTWTVAVTPAHVADEQPVLKLFGEVVAGREVTLRPLVAGPIVEVGDDFVEGGIVDVGDLLIAVDPFDFQADLAERSAQLREAEGRAAELEAELAGAEAMLTQDEELIRLRARDVERRKKLTTSGAGSQKALDDAELALNEQRQHRADRKRAVDVYRARIVQQKAIVQQLRTKVGRALRDLDRTRLTAPFPGFLTDIAVELGQRVGTGDAVARLIDAERLEARFHLSTRQFAELLGGEPYHGRQITVSWGPRDDEITLVGHIDRVEGETETASGGVDLYARLEGVDSESRLRPGAFVRVDVPGRIYPVVVRLPEAALHGDDRIYAVLDDRLDERQVEVVARQGDEILVRGPVAEGDAVVTTRFPEIGPGLKVSVP
jgi:multidrug efflux system membrane fusion protein